MRTTIILLISAAALSAGGWVTLGLLRPRVTVTQTVEGPVVEAFYATGTVMPDREYPLGSNVAGVVDQVMVDKGDPVNKGQVVAIILSDELQLKFKQAEADYKLKQQRAAEESSPVLRALDARIAGYDDLLEIAQREVHRLTDLISKNAASQQDLDRALDRQRTLKSEADSARADRASSKLELEHDLAIAQAALEIARWNVTQQQVRSPVSGVVLDWPTSAGSRLAIKDHVMQVADVSPGNLIMRAQVDEEDKNKVQPRQVVHMTLYSFPDQVLSGVVDRIYDKADTDRRTFEVDVRLADTNGKLNQEVSAGMTGELAFVVNAKTRATVVPSQAVQNGVIWVVRNGKLARTDAKIGLKSVERIEVISGLRPEDTVVISPIGSLTEGQTVRSQHTDPAAAAGLNKPREEAKFKGFTG